MDYSPVTQLDIDRLIEICGTDNVLTGEAIHEDYSRDELAGVRQYPEVVVLPENKEQVVEIVKYANEKHIAITPRGQGTGLVGAAIAIHKGIMLSTEHMNQILELDEANLTLTVEPGVLLMEISQYVEENDLFYAPDPGEKSASI
ncbi:MAG: FAD-binding oxidoreductase, partial [Candidatus Marinimicrobia bacterium]|nr:FAD-binding oxidoreductase [Candidatus Neomarinimicrobiota bacterium]